MEQDGVITVVIHMRAENWCAHTKPFITAVLYHSSLALQSNIVAMDATTSLQESSGFVLPFSFDLGGDASGPSGSATAPSSESSNPFLFCFDSCVTPASDEANRHGASAGQSTSATAVNEEVHVSAATSDFSSPFHFSCDFGAPPLASTTDLLSAWTIPSTAATAVATSVVSGRLEANSETSTSPKEVVDRGCPVDVPSLEFGYQLQTHGVASATDGHVHDTAKPEAMQPPSPLPPRTMGAPGQGPRRSAPPSGAPSGSTTPTTTGRMLQQESPQDAAQGGPLPSALLPVPGAKRAGGGGGAYLAAPLNLTNSATAAAAPSASACSGVMAQALSLVKQASEVLTSVEPLLRNDEDPRIATDDSEPEPDAVTPLSDAVFAAEVHKLQTQAQEQLASAEQQASAVVREFLQAAACLGPNPFFASLLAQPPTASAPLMVTISDVEELLSARTREIMAREFANEHVTS